VIEMHKKTIKIKDEKGFLRPQTIIDNIIINNRTVAKYNKALELTDLTCLEDHIGETIYVFDKKQYSHKAILTKIDRVTQADGTIGHVMNLGPVPQETTNEN